MVKLIDYINKKIKVILKNNFYYKGLVIEADSNFIKLKDLRGSIVMISSDAIFSIEEVIKND